MSSAGSSLLLSLPRELRDEILSHLTLPQYVYTSSTTKDTHNLYRSNHAMGETYIDTRIRLPQRPPANILATCRQLRQECLEYHARCLHAAQPSKSPNPTDRPMSNILAERLGSEFTEEAERACDDSTLRITIEIQRSLRGPHGYYIPIRGHDHLSPRFLGLLPLMDKTKKLRLILWPGYEWWNGGPQLLVDKYGNPRINADEVPKPDAATVAIKSLLDYFPYVEELSVDVLMKASEGERWDLPERKWENMQPWLDAPVAPNVSPNLTKITRHLTAFWEASRPEPFYVQHEVRLSGNEWKVDRKGDMGTPTLRSFCDTSRPDDMDYLDSLMVEQAFVRTD
ncbi:hypothetical protein COCC4DRAFT_43330 [Bipolaris maydis ATCC 48331]|uniref:F-box domain-containing protein n=2 Tax=Cochliobolus heterostrophus TaxID=5016 RepID=M2V4E7_COCH5|nr:uncharacterized protein COCC4DRAFT_43330 [Bipolaris maydis ATCC 48331]EMD94847.1 hypothetical protein COCHEDRAFT_1027375 [Bipolaris maydis C5]KAJ5029249.1 hypothetical protein J3E73DRAFT_406358 [Bipolaris maydis]ENI01861.1 hypothetical protein COCC4DRAFT_43330 [Bipolaris maydis ATCC 48331]KAJ5062014.1 hypothetical protein J3E74DRAFT_449673 [Bipolaris maydis]KAJ6214990.1 hypothetical protein PSV09DRAFT_1027375 [Bipolaris maydis]